MPVSPLLTHLPKPRWITPATRLYKEALRGLGGYAQAYLDSRPAPKPYAPDTRLSLVAEWDGRVRIVDTAPTPDDPQPSLLRGASAHDTLRLEQEARPATQPARELALLLAEHLPVLADQATPTALTIGIFHQSYAPKSPWKFATLFLHTPSFAQHSFTSAIAQMRWRLALLAAVERAAPPTDTYRVSTHPTWDWACTRPLDAILLAAALMDGTDAMAHQMLAGPLPDVWARSDRAALAGARTAFLAAATPPRNKA